MKYEYDENTGYIELTATKWLQRPSNYVTLDIAGYIKNGFLTGEIVDNKNDFEVYLELIQC
ncbi:MAG TPA: hypothetical protein VNR38_06255 [Ureibacillus sp.]|nr:hypothetical protein [Ureibacillus sp.]